MLEFTGSELLRSTGGLTVRWRERLYMMAALAAAGCATPPGPRDATTAHVPVSAQATSSVGSYFGESHPRLLSYWERDLLVAATEASSSRVVEIRATLKRVRDTRSADPSVVRTSGRARGSGVLLADGLIVTGEHVVRNADAITVIFSDGSARVVDRFAVHDRLDLAVLQLEGDPPHSITPWPKGLAARGAAVVALSGGRRLVDGRRFGVVTHTTVSLQDRIDPTGARRYDRLIETTVPLEPGYSGGPLIDAGGRLVGINVAVAGKIHSTDCRGYALPFNAETRQAIAKLAASMSTETHTGEVSRRDRDALRP